MGNVIKPSDNFDYYVGTIYWNNFDQIGRHMAQAISGDESVWWPRYVKDKYGAFDRCVSVNCGNGWVERDVYKAGLIRHATGFDISEKLLLEARREAVRIDMPAEYRIADANNFEPKGLRCDIVINNGAMHHVAYINKLTRQLYEILKPHGIYVLMDYTGPHRNQYSWTAWSRAVEVNASLPEKYRIDLQYPHLKTMLAVDPTEAIHSELQLDVGQRYFDFREKVSLGGGVAYLLLFQNRTLLAEQNTDEGSAVIRSILDADKKLTARHPETNLMSFAVATPKRDALSDTKQVKAWQDEEDVREHRAANNGGRYYPRSALEIINDQIADLRMAVGR